VHLASTTCILSSENLNALDNGPVHQKVNFEPWCFSLIIEAAPGNEQVFTQIGTLLTGYQPISYNGGVHKKELLLTEKVAVCGYVALLW